MNIIADASALSQPPGVELIAQHMMRIFHDLSGEEQKDMSEWIVLMAATRVRTVMEAGEGEVDLANISRVSEWRLVGRVVGPWACGACCDEERSVMTDVIRR